MLSGLCAVVLGVTSFGVAPTATAQADPSSCTVVGTRRADVLRGTPRADVICGLGGNDVLVGGGGDDTLRGGAGTDVLRGGSGNDRLNSGPGADRLFGGAGADWLKGGTGPDVLSGGTGHDVATYSAKSRGVSVSVGAGANDGTPRERDDVRASTEEVLGTAYADRMVGNDGANVLRGNGGPDSLVGGRGNDLLFGGPGGDRLDARDGSAFVDRLSCGDGADEALPDPADRVDADCEAFPGNHAPTDIVLSNSSVPENEPAGTTVGSLSAVDPDAGDVHTYSLVSGTGDTDNGSFGIAGTQLVTDEVFDFEADSSYSVRVAVSDGRGGSRAESFTIMVTDVSENDAPATVDDTLATEEDTSLSLPVSGDGSPAANDTDADGDALTVTAVTAATGGTASITADQIHFVPTEDLCGVGAGHFDYTVSDGHGGSDTGHVTVDLSCVPDPPNAVDDTATVTEDDPASGIDVLANDTDVDGGPMAIESVTVPDHGSVAITHGGDDLSYTPDPNYCNAPGSAPADGFSYTLNGGSTATVAVTVTCVDDDPTAVDDTASVAEDSDATAIDVLANDKNADGGPISVGAVTVPDHGSVAITDGGSGLTYTPDPNYCNAPPGTATDAFTYTLNAGSTGTVAVTVTCVDDAPTAVDDTATVTEDDPASGIDVVANDTDPDGGPMTVESITQPDHGTAGITGGGTGLTYAPDANYCNAPGAGPADTFSYTLNGGDTATVAVTVTCVDDAPTAVDDTATVAEDSGVTEIDVLANDQNADDGPISIASVILPDHGTVAITAGGAGVTYTPDANYCNDPSAASADTFSYTLTSGSTATVSVTVTCVDDAPVAVDDTATVAEDGGATSIDVRSNDTDIDAGPKTIAQVTQPDHGTVTITHAGDDLTYTPDANYCNDPSAAPADTFGYTLNGGDTATVAVTVTCVDDAPTAVDDTATVTEDDAATGIDVLANDTDLDSGPISVDAVTQPANGTAAIVGNGTGVTYAPNPDYCTNPPLAPDSFSYTLAPGGSTAVVSVMVTCVDDAPVAVDDTATVTEDSGATTIDVRANDTDVDGGPMAIGSVTQPDHGTVAITHAGDDLTYTPDANYCNDPSVGPADTFGYTLNGGDTATVAVTVTCVDDAPTAVDDTATVTLNASSTVIDVLGNDTDIDGGPMVITSATDPAHGTVVLTGGSAGARTGLTYEPDAGFCDNDTPDTFAYTLNGGSAATVSITVNCDLPPTAVDDTATVTEDDAATAIDVRANDTDADGGPKTITQVTQPDNGTVVITSSGDDLTYTPDANYCNAPPGTTPDTFIYTLNGGESATVSITVTCVDDSPVAVDDSATVLEDSAATAVDVRANDTDADAGPKTITSATQPDNGTVVLTGGSVGAHTGLTYQPDANYCNDPAAAPEDTFSYTLNGGDSATVSVAVTCVPDNPVVDTSAGSTGYTENAAATVIDAAVSVSDPDPGTTITGATVKITGNFAAAQDVLALAGSHAGITALFAGDTLTLSGDATATAYQAALRDVSYRNSSDDPSTAARTVTFTVIDDTSRSGSDTKGLTVTAVDDPPVAVNDSATVLEDVAATAVTVLSNDTDVDAGPKTISSAADPANGTVVLTGGSIGAHTGLTYQPDPNYCNDPPGTTKDTFTYTLNGGSQATVSMTVTCVNDAPVADDETFNGANSAVGNTALVVDDGDDAAPALNAPKKSISGDILAGDTDVDGPGPLAVVAGTYATNDGGSVTIETDGDFTYRPAASTSCTDTSDFFDYTLTDQNSPTAGTDVGRVTIAITGCVWYVSNNAAGNSGTSTAPFDTVAQAETASVAGQTVFVFDGDNTTTGYAAGISLKANQVLTSEVANLVVGSDTLWTGVPGTRPTLTANNADVVDLGNNNTVRGFAIDPQGTGGGIAGSGGDTGGGTIDDVNIVDTGTPGTQPGLELDSTTGSFSVSNFSVDNTGATAPPNTASGVRLNNAGTVVFAPGTPVTVTTKVAKALDLTGTALGTSTFDDVTVTAATNGAVSLSGTTGTIALGDDVGADLSLTTASGTAAAFLLNNAGTVTVGGGGTDNVSATGGPAVDVTGASSLVFDDVDSASSSGDGVNLDGFGTGTFTSGSGSAITGASAIGFDVNLGNGNIAYDGSISTTAGGSRPVEVTNRTGGLVDFNGTINAGGSGVNLTGNGGATVRFDGGLSLSTGTAAGFNATGGGNVVVTDGNGSGTVPDNTVTTTTGTAVNVANTTIGADGLTFLSVGANGAASGIVLNNTGSSGGLSVTGTGTANSGGTIQNTTSHGIMLTATRGPSFDRMNIHDTAGSGVRGTGVTDFTFKNGTINNSGTAGGNQDSSIAFNDPTGSATDVKVQGTVTITGNTLTNARWHGVSILQFAGTLDDVNISNNVLTSGTTTGTGGNSLGSGIQLFVGGTAGSVASVTRAELNNNTISNFPGGVLMALQSGTSNGSGPTGNYGTPNSATNDIEVQNNILNGGGTTPDGVGGFIKPNQLILATANGRGVANFNIQNNGTALDPMSGSIGNIIDLSAGGSVTVKAVISGNRIDAAGQSVSGTSGIAAGVGPFTVTGPTVLSNSTLYATVQNNVIAHSAGSGIRLNVNAGDPTLNATVTGNNVSAPLSATYAIQVVQGSNPGFTGNTNLQVANNTATGGTGGGNTFPGIGLRKFGTTAGEFAILNLNPTTATNTQMETYVSGQNPASASGTFGTGGTAAVNGSSANWTATATIPSPP